MVYDILKGTVYSYRVLEVGVGCLPYEGGEVI